MRKCLLQKYLRGGNQTAAPLCTFIVAWKPKNAFKKKFNRIKNNLNYPFRCEGQGGRRG